MTSSSTTPTTATPLLLSQLNPGNDLQDTLKRLENDVRREPASASRRWALAEMLCLLGHWPRALKQVQTSSQLAGAQDASWHSRSQMVRGLIRAEMQRQEVFAGRAMPLPVIDRPQWMDALARAISLHAAGDHAEADRVRAAALVVAPTRPMLCSCAGPREADASGASEAPDRLERHFEWIGDSDTRLGPVCEFIAAGGYRWVAFADIACMRLPPPTRLLDLVWLPATLRLRGTRAGDRPLHGFVPTRYSGSERSPAAADGHERDALALARLTRWQEVGETGVFATGQKTLMTDAGDVPLLTLRELRTPDGPQGPGERS